MSGFDFEKMNTEKTAAEMRAFGAGERRAEIASQLQKALNKYQPAPEFQKILDDHKMKKDTARLALVIMWDTVARDSRVQKLTAADLRALADAGKPSPNEDVFRRAAKTVAAAFHADKKERAAVEDILLDALKEYASTFAYMLDEEPEGLSIGGKRLKDVEYPLDKPNQNIWELVEENTHGQLILPIDVSGQRSETPIDIMYSINFDNIESEFPFVKRLTGYDKRVFIVSASLFFGRGNTEQSIDQIYHAMGYSGTPGKTDRRKILTSFTKFRAWITLDNRKEIEAGYNYPLFEYEGPLLAYSQVNEIDKINGQPTKTTFHISTDPRLVPFPLITFARGRDQITTIPPEVLASPLSKTEENLAIEDYMIERIAFAKSGREPKKILFSTICEKTGITGKQRQRLPEKLERLLNHYHDCGMIGNFRMNKDSVTLIFKKPGLEDQKGK